jgi:xylulokinase
MPAVIIGIDLGTQGAKAVLAGLDLSVAAQDAVPYSTSHPRPGWAEQEPAAWEAAVGRAVAGVLGRAGVDPGAVLAIGVTGQLDGCVAVGPDGRPLHPCLIWMDRRAAWDLPRSVEDRVRRVAGMNPDPGHMAMKIRWLRDNVPACARAACFHQPVSYLVRQLTGEDVYDHGLASTTMMYGIEQRDYDEVLLAGFSISRRLLPGIKGADELAGRLTGFGARLTGLPEGVPVAVGTGDDFASPLGAGLVRPGSVACVSGTAEVVGALSETPRVDPAGLVETHSYPGGLSFIENPGWLSGGSLAWLAGISPGGGTAGLDRQAAATPAGSAGALFIPALSGSMSPQWIPTARGCFYGLTAAHGTGHLARAVMEGSAFAMRDVVERLQALAVPAERILLIGGGSRSRLWGQIRADVSGLPVLRARHADTAPLGAAMLAAVAAGLQPDLRRCAALLRPEWEEHAPDPDRRRLYDDAHARYLRLFDCLRPMFNTGEER